VPAIKIQVGNGYWNWTSYRLLSFAMELTLSSAALDQMYRSWIRSDGVTVGFSERELLEFVMFDPSPRYPPICSRCEPGQASAVRQSTRSMTYRPCRRFNLSQVVELIAIQLTPASTIISRMVGDFYTTLRWRLLRGFMLWLYGRRCMRCGSTYRVEVDHIIARARGEFGRGHQWMPRNLQVLCHEHNQEKMTKFDDWRPLWARVLMPVRDKPAAYHAETHPALGSHHYHACATAPMHVVRVGRPHPLSPCPSRTNQDEGNTHPSCDGLHKAYKSDLEPAYDGDHWALPIRLAWDVGVVLAVASLLLLIARIVGHCVGFKWRW
jgi:5-methylcytosine-specific restriction endonuclease McrA